VLWLLLGMALFRDKPVHEVARRLNVCAQSLASKHLLARSGVTEERKRLGADPVEWLFRKTGTQWGAQRYDEDDWHGLQVFAMDGTLLRTPDPPELRDHFGSGNTPSDRQTPFPMMRLVALMNVRSHLILDAQLGPYRRSEMRLADEFLQQIPDHSVMLFDKGFWGAEMLSSLSNVGTHRHWLIPAKKGTVCEESVHYGEHDRLVRMKVSPQARKRSPALGTHWEAREVSYEIQGRVKTVMTSCQPPPTAPRSLRSFIRSAGKSLGFRDIKSSMPWLDRTRLVLRHRNAKIDISRGQAAGEKA
jgi:hypothetical protein